MAQFENVPKFSIEGLFRLCKGKFVFPDYQRPYSWEEEHVEKLFNDIADFTIDYSKSNNENKRYFLGAVIACSAGQNIEVTDGRQRITSLILLLRAIYNKLGGDNPQNNLFVEGSNKQILNRIESILWESSESNNIFSSVATCYKDKPKIDSNVIDEKDVVKNFFHILETGNVVPVSRDKYSKNYLFFQQKLAEMDEQYTNFTLGFSRCLLDKVEVVVIAADDQDMALTIFSTLNDSGLPLSDADIFKAKIYGFTKGEIQKKQFIDKWQKLSKDAEEIEESLQRLFYYYMMLCRAKFGDVNTGAPRLRDYFELHRRKYYQPNVDKDKADEEIVLLKDEKLMEHLVKILNFWRAVQEADIEEKWVKNKQIINAIDILTEYPNEYWKYPVITYYFCHSNESDFEEQFLKFLRMLTVKLIVNYLKNPTVTKIKSDVMNLSKSCVESKHPVFRFDKVTNIDEVKNSICASTKITKMLLKVLAYCEQDEKLPNFEIEHIFPKKWQKNFFPNFSDSFVNDLVEHLGNKIPLEKKLNIVANNNFYSRKAIEYSKSRIQLAKDFSTKGQWNLPADIFKRDGQIEEQLKQKFNQWENDYKNYHD